MPSKYPASDPRAYQFWKDRLEGKAVTSEDPRPGRWRILARQTNNTGNTAANKNPVPKSYGVAIWPANEAVDGKYPLIVKIGFKTVLTEGTPAFDEFAAGAWIGVVPVTTEQYQKVADGGDWPNENSVASNAIKMPEPQTFEDFEREIGKLVEEAQRMIEKGEATDKDTADQAGDVANILSILVKKADAMREREKAPHRKAAEEVDNKWRPLCNEKSDTVTAMKRLKSVVAGPWLIKENARLKALAEEDAKKRAAAVAEAEANGEEPPAEIVNAPAPKATATAGARGRGVHITHVKKAKINDYQKALVYFAENVQVKELIQDLANALARSGQAADGCEIYEEPVTR